MDEQTYGWTEWLMNWLMTKLMNEYGEQTDQNLTDDTKWK